MTNSSLSLKTAIDKLSSAKVICVGDVMLDKFVYGEIERISPEAPIPVLRCISETSMLGGGGNVARNIIGLGGYCKFVSVVGKDAAGKELISQVGKLKNLDARLITDPKRETSIKTRFIASNQQVMRADTETIEPITSETEKLVLDAISREAGAFAAIVLADYGKGVLSDGLAQKILSFAKTNKIPVVVDPQGSNYLEYANAAIVTPNKKELREITKKQFTKLRESGVKLYPKWVPNDNKEQATPGSIFILPFYPGNGGKVKKKEEKNTNMSMFKIRVSYVWIKQGGARLRPGDPSPSLTAKSEPAKVFIELGGKESIVHDENWDKFVKKGLVKG